mgnify:CR=1 FL=1
MCGLGCSAGGVRCRDGDDVAVYLLSDRYAEALKCCYCPVSVVFDGRRWIEGERIKPSWFVGRVALGNHLNAVVKGVSFDANDVSLCAHTISSSKKSQESTFGQIKS